MRLKAWTGGRNKNVSNIIIGLLQVEEEGEQMGGGQRSDRRTRNRRGRVTAYNMVSSHARRNHWKAIA